MTLLRRRSGHCIYGDKLEEQLRDRQEQAESNLSTIYSSHNTTPVHKIESNNETRKKFKHKNFERYERKLVK